MKEMEKKVYAAPAWSVCEVDLRNSLLDVSPGTSMGSNNDVDPGGDSEGGLDADVNTNHFWGEEIW